MNRIRELREQRGIKQLELAKLLNCTNTSISRYELGQHDLPTEVIGALCDYFGVTADYLLGRSSNPAPAISDEDAALLRAYHAAPLSIQAAIKTLLQPYQKESEADQAV